MSMAEEVMNEIMSGKATPDTDVGISDGAGA